MMKYIFKAFLILTAIFIVVSCKKDESSTTANINLYVEQEPIDNAAIVEFLSTHYYNQEEFDNLSGDPSFHNNIKFYTNEVLADIDANEDGDKDDTNDTVVGYDSNGDGVIDANDDDHTTTFTRTLLINLPADKLYTKTITLKDPTTDEEVEHKLYVLNLNQGGGPVKPRFCDRAFIEYEGQTLSLYTFDEAVTPIQLDLSSSVRGFSEGISEFNVAGNLDGISAEADGEYPFEDFGVGAIFMPSGLGYYANPVGTQVPSYSPLIFKVKVFAETQLDHDLDGVPTYLEDVNLNRDLRDDNLDEDTFPNYADNDDDGDTVLTKEEVEIIELDPPYLAESDPEPTLAANEYIIRRRIDETAPAGANVVYTYVRIIDTDADGIPDYLDTDDDNDGTLTKNEDADGDGQVTDDDTDGDGIPDYLDTDN
ncbi:FKBP-type peptidyl-prolyl cis-trans isomerase [Pseudofulvibacter geojedonensis]|uniref:FKBP-type peptidyl-prolyl cis-trans isomerase n=1 Tax=Pseudofulvibacter geojedonensis TaxID=1123758 RepID=A0ABW3I259_9FLAO